jgi:hypothetical protein
VIAKLVVGSLVGRTPQHVSKGHGNPRARERGQQMGWSVFAVFLVIVSYGSFVSADSVERTGPYRLHRAEGLPGLDGAAWTGATLLADGGVSVWDYGAVGDGVTDDTVAIQAAVNDAVAAGAATVLFPPGTYRCRLMLDTSGRHPNASHVSLQGSGINATHLMAVDADGPVIRVTGKAAGAWMWAVCDLSLVGNGRDCNGIEVSDVSGLLTCCFENVAFFECRCAFHNTGALRYMFDRCTFSRNDFGVYIEPGPEACGGGAFQDCHWRTNYKAAFVLLDAPGGDAVQDVHVAGGVNQDNLGFAFFLKGGAGRVRAPIIDSVHMEANGTAASVVIAGKSYEPNDIYLEDVGHIVMQNMTLAGVDVISNTLVTTTNCVWQNTSGTDAVADTNGAAVSSDPASNSGSEMSPSSINRGTDVLWSGTGSRNAHGDSSRRTIWTRMNLPDTLPAAGFTPYNADGSSHGLGSTSALRGSDLAATFGAEANTNSTTAPDDPSAGTAPRDLRDGAIDVEAAAALFQDQWTNVKWCGAKGDGKSDDTRAIQLAIEKAKASSGVLYFPTGQYRITDGLEIDESLTVCGSRGVFRDWSSHGWFVPKGAVILFDAQDADTSPVFKCTFDTPKKGNPLVFRDLTIKVTANARQADRHGIEVHCTVGSTLSDVIFERLVFVTIPGDCIYIHGNCYLGHPISFRDIKAYEAGRLIRVYDENQGYIAGLVTLENCDFEGATLIPKQSPLVDLRSAGILTIRNLLCEGYDMSGKTVLGLGSGSGRVLVDNYYSEWSGASPQYDIEIDGHPGGNGGLLNAHSYRRLKLEAPIRIGVSSVKVEVENAYWDDAYQYDQILSVAEGLQQVDVRLRNVRYNGTNLSAAQLFGRFMEPNTVGRIHADGFASDGIAQGMRFETPDTACLYEWTAAKGRLSTYHTRYFAPKNPPIYFARYGSGDSIVTDPQEGRVAKFIGDQNRCPMVYWDWSLPRDYRECELMMAVRYKVEAVGAPDGLSYHLSAQSGQLPGKRYYFTRIVDTANYIVAPDGWSVAVAKYMVGPTGYMGFRCTNPPENGSYNLYISHVWVGLGDKIPFLRGDVAGNQPIEWKDTTCPTDTNWALAAGDMVINSGPDPGEPSGWIYANSAWVARDTLPGATAKTANYAIEAGDNGKRFSNAGATGPVMFLLCPSGANLEFEFVRVEPHPIYIAPQGPDCVRGGNRGQRLILETDGDLVRLGCFKANMWDMVRVVRADGTDKPFAFTP